MAAPSKIIVVGAGPAGCTAALRLARIPNVTVQLLERRSLAAFMAAADSPLAYPMVLSNRALDTLAELDLELPSTSAPYEGICFLPSRSVMRQADESATRLVSRQQLSLDLLRNAAQLNNISIRFATVPYALDTTAQRLSVHSSEPATDPVTVAQLLEDLARSGEREHHAQGSSQHAQRPQSTNVAGGLSTELAVRANSTASAAHRGEDLSDELDYELLVGADGRSSGVRALLAQLGQIRTACVYDQNESAYKTFTDVCIPGNPDGEAFPFAAPSVTPRRHLYFVDSQVSSVCIKFVFWRSDADHLCGMIPGSTDALADNMDLASLTSAFTGRLPPWMLEQVAEQCAEQALHRFGTIETCDRFHGEGGVVLIGDAAHAVTSTLGQGCNMALESIKVLGSIADRCAAGEQGLRAVPAQFTGEWQPNAQAMQRLEMMNVLLKNSKLGSLQGLPGLTVSHSKVAMGSAMLFGMAQWKLMPNTFTTIPMFGMLYDARYQYRDVLAYVERAATICYCVLLMVALSIGSNFVDVVELAP